MSDKKNLDGLKTCDGPSQAVQSGGFMNPGMRMETLRATTSHVGNLLEKLSGQPTKVSALLGDTAELLRCLAIRYGDIPVVDLADMLVDEAYKNYKEELKNEENKPNGRSV